MNVVELEGVALHSDIIFLPEHSNIAVCRIILKNDDLTCVPVFCFGKMAVEVKKSLGENNVIHATGKLITYLFHDAFDTEKIVTMILAENIVMDNITFEGFDNKADTERECLKSMCEHNMLPVSEAYYEFIAKELTELTW